MYGKNGVEGDVLRNDGISALSYAINYLLVSLLLPPVQKCTHIISNQL